MGDSSKSYGILHAMYCAMSIIPFIVLLYIVAGLGDMCKQTCPLMVAKPVDIPFDIRNKMGIELDKPGGQVDWATCKGEKQGYCILGKSQRCETKEDIEARGFKAAFDQKCFYCEQRDGVMQVFAPMPQSGSDKWRSTQACGTPVNVANKETTPPIHDAPWYNYKSKITPKAYTDYPDKFYPGGGNELSLCWTMPADWAFRGAVYNLNLTLMVLYGTLSVTSLLIAISFFSFTSVYESDWQKLSGCKKCLGCVVRFAVPIQRFLHMCLGGPLILDLVLFLPDPFPAACASVVNEHSIPVFQTAIRFCLFMSAAFYVLGCCGGFAFRKMVKIETSFYCPGVTEVQTTAKTCPEKCMKNCCFLFKAILNGIWSFGP